LICTVFEVVCKGLCPRYKAKKPFGVNGRYGNGQKRCSICAIFINWDGKHCPCCGYVLRTKPKGTQTRQKLMISQQVKRIWKNYLIWQWTCYSSLCICHILLQMYPHQIQAKLLMNDICDIILSWISIIQNQIKIVLWKISSIKVKFGFK